MEGKVSYLVKEGYEKSNVSAIIAAFDKEIDTYAEDVLIQADHLMYDNKRKGNGRTNKLWSKSILAGMPSITRIGISY